MNVLTTSSKIHVFFIQESLILLYQPYLLVVLIESSTSLMLWLNIVFVLCKKIISLRSWVDCNPSIHHCYSLCNISARDIGIVLNGCITKKHWAPFDGKTGHGAWSHIKSQDHKKQLRRGQFISNIMMALRGQQSVITDKTWGFFLNIDNKRANYWQNMVRLFLYLRLQWWRGQNRVGLGTKGHWPFRGKEAGKRTDEIVQTSCGD